MTLVETSGALTRAVQVAFACMALAAGTLVGQCCASSPVQARLGARVEPHWLGGYRLWVGCEATHFETSTGTLRVVNCGHISGAPHIEVLLNGAALGWGGPNSYYSGNQGIPIGPGLHTIGAAISCCGCYYPNHQPIAVLSVKALVPTLPGATGMQSYSHSGYSIHSGGVAILSAGSNHVFTNVLTAFANNLSLQGPPNAPGVLFAGFTPQSLPLFDLGVSLELDPVVALPFVFDAAGGFAAVVPRGTTQVFGQASFLDPSSTPPSLVSTMMVDVFL